MVEAGDATVKVVMTAGTANGGKLDLESVSDASTGKRKAWLGVVAGLVILIVLGIGLGVGLGVGLKHKSNSNANSLSIDPSLRTYYISADQVSWSYSDPLGSDRPDADACADPQALALQPSFHPVPSTQSGVFLKAVYREYTDASFTTLKQKPDNQQHLGILGPLIYAEEGSTIQVVFRNNLPPSSSKPTEPGVNIEPTGGATWSVPNPGFLPAVLPGEKAVYKWTMLTLDSSTATNANDANSRLFLYHSSANPSTDDNSGLVGPIIVTAKGQANPDGTTKGVDRDIVTLYQVYNEKFSAFLNQNLQTVPNTVIVTKMAINGFTYCNLPSLEVVQGENVRWHVASIGSELSTHNFHWHGNTLLHSGNRVDHMNLLGMSTATLQMQPDAVGSWLFHCHLNAHLSQGMKATYTVKPAATSVTPAPLTGITRTYYIQAENVTWNYAPSGGEMCSGSLQPFGDHASLYLGPTEGIRIGSLYEKAVYKRYTDATFTTEVPRSANEQYMGLIGPIMRANVGDTIKVVFKNKLKYYASMHPHGVKYDKANEGAPYVDGTSGNDKLDDMVAPGTTYTYTWTVPERAGPGPSEPSSKLWMYHSHVDEAADTNAGLVGGIVINKPGAVANATATAADGVSAPIPSDVDQEAFFFFTVMDEYASSYNVDNIQKNLDPSLWQPQGALQQLYANPEFREASLHHMINGFMYCNMPVVNFTTYQHVRFHVMAMGSQEDIHSPSIMGGTFMTLGSHQSAMIQLSGTMTTSDVVFTEPGSDYHIECRVADHVIAGMEASYNVLPNPKPPQVVTGGRLRTYYIKAEKKVWDYAPQGYVRCTDEDLSLTAANYLNSGIFDIGSKREKALFVQYTDDTFTTVQPRPSYLGVMGALIGVEVGDTLEVVLKNDLPFAVNFAPDGGFTALHNTSVDSIAPGQTFTYKFLIPQQAGPLTGDLSSTSLLYISDVDMVAHTAAGLLGVIVVTNSGGLKADGITPVDADMLLPLHFQVFNEEASPLYEEWLNATISEPNRALVNPDNDMMASINGFMYCNMPSPQIPQGAQVRVVWSSYGSEEGNYSPRIVGQAMATSSGAVTSGQLLPAVSMTANVQTVTQGVWPIVDDIHEHMQGGMIATINVVAPTSTMATQTRRMLRALRA